MGASITLAGEDLIAQKQIAQEGLDVVRFIFANVPGLDHTGPVDRAAGLPDAGQIVYTATIPAENKGYVNPSQVVYSAQIGSDVGDWDFNWIGLETAEDVLFAVSYVPLQQKRRNILPLQLGNNLTRNFLVVFDGAQALTGITIDASTWQHDFTVRLAGIDERERLSNRDVYGRACFFGSSLQLEKVGGAYQLKPGTAYIEGIRLALDAALPVVPDAVPGSAWLDVALQRELNDVVASWEVVWGAGLVDYLDTAGVQHYLVQIADLPDINTVTDLRSVEPIEGALVGQFAFRVGDYADLRARATTKDDVGLGNLPNAKSDDENTDSSLILATTKAVKAASALIWNAIANIVSGATTVGKSAKLATAHKITLSGAVTGDVNFDGSADVILATTGAAATEAASGVVKLASVAKALEGLEATTAVTPEGLGKARMRRIARLSSAAVQSLSGAQTGPTAFAPLSFSFEADGGVYLILVKVNVNNDTSGAGGNNYVSTKLLNGATVLDTTSMNITMSIFYGQTLPLLYSGPLTGQVNLSVTFEKTSIVGSVSVNGDRDNLTSNDSGQLSCIEIYRMGA